jgi:hypothetical protein
MPQKPQKEEGLVDPSSESDRKQYGSQKRQKSGIEVYSDWFATLPLPEQQSLLRQGLGPEAREGDGNYTFEVNADHSAYATLDPQYEDYIEPEEQRTYTDDEVQEVVRRVVMAMQMSESPDCLFQARCILIAFGIGDPPTETELAKQKDCSRQFVSKKVKRIQQMFNLAPSQFMRSEQACEAYSLAWQRQQQRLKEPAPALQKPYKPRRALARSQNNQTASKPVATQPIKPSKRTYRKSIKHLQSIYNHPPATPPTPLPPRKESIIKPQKNAGSLDTTAGPN